MKTRKFVFGPTLFFLILVFPWETSYSQSIQIGAYYFDGWSGTFRQKLMVDFKEREPIWGWRTSTQEVVDAQIDAASTYGISFFSFCWYFKANEKRTMLDADEHNNALKFFIKSKNKSKLKFNLMVANHEGYRILPKDWNELCLYWCNIFKDPSYLMTNDRPLITFFDIASLLSAFQTAEGVNAALARLKTVAVQNGLNGVTIAASVSSSDGAALAQNLGFDLVTGYNYHGYGLWTKDNLEVVPINQMLIEKTLWKTLATASQKPVIPVITLNWDRRPLDPITTTVSPRFTGFSAKSVADAVESCKKWMLENKNIVTAENIAVMYAWNEYGEGAWLTPGKNGHNFLDGVKKALLGQMPSTVGP